jgi:hypothetical protein
MYLGCKRKKRFLIINSLAENFFSTHTEKIKQCLDCFVIKLVNDVLVNTSPRYCPFIILQWLHHTTDLILINIFFVLYSTLLHLPPLRFHCAEGCWDRSSNPGPLQLVHWQTDAKTTRLDLTNKHSHQKKTILLRK